MQVQLTLAGTPLSNYFVLDPLAQPGDNSRVSADPTNLDNLIDNNEISSFIIDDVVDYLPIQLRPKSIIHYTNKLKHGGEIVINALNMDEVARLIHRKELYDTLTVNKILFGAGTNLWSIRKSYIPVMETCQILTQAGQMDIMKVSFDNLHYVVKARRK